MAVNTERGKCRICGMTCDFAGQVYCRNCLKKINKREKNEERMRDEEIRYYETLNRENRGRRTGTMTAGDSKAFLKSFFISFLIGMVIAFGISFYNSAPHSEKGYKSSNRGAITSNGKNMETESAQWECNGAVDYYLLLEKRLVSNEAEWMHERVLKYYDTQVRYYDITLEDGILRMNSYSYRIEQSDEDLNLYYAYRKDAEGALALYRMDKNTLIMNQDGMLYLYKRK